MQKDNNEEKRAKLTDDELDEIASRLESKLYENIGKGVINKLFWSVGIITVSVYAYLKSKGVIL